MAEGLHVRADECGEESKTCDTVTMLQNAAFCDVPNGAYCPPR